MSRSASSPERSEAAVALPHLRLQLLLRERPEWRGHPVAVVADESPDAPLLELSRPALLRGLRPGLRLGAARNIDLELRTAAIDDARMSAASEALAEGLTTFSPRVERADGRPGPLAAPGSYFLDPRGLAGLYGDQERWARSVHGYLAGRGFQSSVVLGDHPHRCLVLARAGAGVRVFEPDAERAEAATLDLRRVGLAERICGPLARLGVDTIGDLLELRADELTGRFGAEAATLHRLLSDGGQLPLQARRPVEPLAVQVTLEPPSADRERLAFVLKRSIDDLLAQTVARHRVLSAMILEFRMEPYGHDPRGRVRKLVDSERLRVEILEPATPTREGRAWMDLWRLRLGEIALPAPVEALALRGESVDPDQDQLVTAALAPPRDPRAATEALARVAAVLGRESVGVLRPRDAHLPEGSTRLVPLEGRLPLPAALPAPPELVALRRLARPRPLARGGGSWPRAPSPVDRADGPHRLSGGWWGADARPVAREYWYLHLRDGAIWWVFHDEVRSRWYLHAEVG